MSPNKDEIYPKNNILLSKQNQRYNVKIKFVYLVPFCCMSFNSCVTVSAK